MLGLQNNHKYLAIAQLEVIGSKPIGVESTDCKRKLDCWGSRQTHQTQVLALRLRRCKSGTIHARLAQLAERHLRKVEVMRSIRIASIIL